jgi:hypothetical protein
LRRTDDPATQAKISPSLGTNSMEDAFICLWRQRDRCVIGNRD